MPVNHLTPKKMHRLINDLMDFPKLVEECPSGMNLWTMREALDTLYAGHKKGWPLTLSVAIYMHEVGYEIGGTAARLSTKGFNGLMKHKNGK